MSDWQDISTAPKDGTAVYAGKVGVMSIGGAPLYPLVSRYLDGKWQSVFGDNRWAPYEPQPTHWRPHPSSPSP
jgi:hypothetical protein